MINELPFRLRKQQENMILCGLWFGQNKPFVPTFFDPLHKSLKNLDNGVDIQTEGKTFRVKGHLVCMSCDIPARSMVLNMNQHNGEYACIKCVQSGKNLRTDKGGNIRIFPYQEHQDPHIDVRSKLDHSSGPPRTALESYDDGVSAGNSGKAIHGIKGPSFLMQCPGFDFVKWVTILTTCIWFSWVLYDCF